MDAHGPSYRPCDIVTRAYRGQINEPDTIWVVGECLIRRLQSEPGLSDPTGSADGHQALTSQEVDDLLYLSLAPHEAAHPCRQAMASMAAVERGPRAEG